MGIGAWLLSSAALGGWAGLYGILRLRQPHKTTEWHCRSVTVVHALTVLGLAGWAWLVEGPSPWIAPAIVNTPLQEFTAAICLGYFVFDFLWCLYFDTEGAVMLAHHMFSIAGNAGVLIKGHHGSELMATIFGAELTNPLLQMRWFLRQADRHRTWYGELNDILFMGTFGIARLGFGTSLWWSYIHHPRPDLQSKVGATGFYLVGWIFWYAIVNYAHRKYFGHRLKKKNDELLDKKPDASTNGVASSSKGHGHVISGTETKEENGNIVTNGSLVMEYDDVS